MLRAVAGGWDRAVAGCERAVDRADWTVERWSERAVESRAVDGATSIGALETCVGCGARAPYTKRTTRESQRSSPIWPMGRRTFLPKAAAAPTYLATAATVALASSLLRPALAAAAKQFRAAQGATN